MPNDYESWYQQQVEKGLLPDKSGYYHYIPFTDEEKQYLDEE